MPSGRCGQCGCKLVHKITLLRRIAGAFLKETIDDLEWAASGSRGVELRMEAQPVSVSLCSYGTSGDLLIDLPASELQVSPPLQQVYLS